MGGLLRQRLRISGTVQGVGYRPFVHGLATALELDGTVWNDAGGVVIDIAGDADRIATFVDALRTRAPRLAVVDEVRVDSSEPLPAPPHRAEFRIAPSDDAGTAHVTIPPDSATCDACLRELFDPNDRRYRYPFINCTDCGPRYTIVQQLPYDRPRTTMAAFRMCHLCQAEYGDPASRRFHAQPNACPDCGPQLALEPCDGAPPTPTEALDAAIDALRQGEILAVKGLGGYHLAVDATDDHAVRRLRRLKHRYDKPFAVMVAGVAQARRLVALSSAATRLLMGPEASVIVAPAMTGGGLSPSVAPGLAEVGVMAAYTGLHHLLVRGVGRPLVMTSGNISGEPIVYHDDEARSRLGSIADRVLSHNRAIETRCDDGVVRASPDGRWQALRRSRGNAPSPFRLPVACDRAVLAVGAELKNTVALAYGAHVTVSHHIGDLAHAPAHRSFTQAVRHLPGLLRRRPEVIAHDLHPEYLSTKWAVDADLPLFGVQHHHAHIASCLVEHGRADKVIGVAFDGSGWGPDGTVWGGEILVASLDGYDRLARLRPVPLPGGAAAVREPWRMAVSWALAVDSADGGERAARIGPDLDERWELVAELCRRPATLVTSSVGRLFDAAAALLGVRARSSYEGQAAMELEALAVRGRAAPLCDPAALLLDPGVLDAVPLIQATMLARGRGVDVTEIAAGFHHTLSLAVAELAVSSARLCGLSTVALSGGVFQNALLSRIVQRRLEALGVEILQHQLIPANDGGISVGQAAIAAAGCARGLDAGAGAARPYTQVMASSDGRNGSR